MELSIAALASNLLAPTILFFVLGLIAANARSDLSIPNGAAKIMSIMLLALPQAKSGIYLTLALGVTFPFNLTLGMPLYFLLATLV